MGAQLGQAAVMKLVYAPEVRADLLRIRSFYLEFDSNRGLRLGVQLRAELKLLNRYPRLGQRIDDAALGDVEMRRLMISGCDVRYAIAGREVRVLRSWHEREDR